MFEGADFPKSLDEELFDSWLEHGRDSKMSYAYMLVIWNELDASYQPLYMESREALNEYAQDKTSHDRERLIAAYDLYSEAKII